MRRRPPTLFSRQAIGLAVALLVPLVCAAAADDACEPAAGIEELARLETAPERSGGDDQAIDAAFRESEIEIPFPRRDLHIRRWSDGAAPPPGEAPTHSDGDSL